MEDECVPLVTFSDRLEAAVYDMEEREHLIASNRQTMFSWNIFFSRLVSNCCWNCFSGRDFSARSIRIGQSCSERFPPNVVLNQKYSVLTFIPLVLYFQFKIFLNLFFLLMALSQFVPAIRVGYIYTYWGPLGFVLLVTIIREAVDDFRRYRRDKELNDTLYTKLTPNGKIKVKSSKIKIGDIIHLSKDERVPADMVLLRTTEVNGSCFVRTDQLDGETDWKLRLPISFTQILEREQDIFNIEADIYAEKPQKDIHTFIGTFMRSNASNDSASLSVENTMWANSVLASGTALGLVVYTGYETRSVMNNSRPRSKFGILDSEINHITKILFVFVLALAIVMMCLKGWNGPWYFYLFRFVLLFSYIIPLSLRVNLDMSKIFYSWSMQQDKCIQGAVVRTTTIPEELGRIEYIFTDKTGTLTQNNMTLRKIYMPSGRYDQIMFDEIADAVRLYFGAADPVSLQDMTVRQVSESVLALALCHKVSPTFQVSKKSENNEPSIHTIEFDHSSDEEQCFYQASSPDEIALVTWTSKMGITLERRDIDYMALRTCNGTFLEYDILQEFPFSSELKRMGIILRDRRTNRIVFYLKGADTVMQSIVECNDWLAEECDNLARDGLRTLVVACKHLTENQYSDFMTALHSAKMSVNDRCAQVAAVMELLERDMHLLCVTGVEDRLQENVRNTLELLRNAGIKIWMLTGDKLETAACIAESSLLVAKSCKLYIMPDVSDRDQAREQYNAMCRKDNCALVIKGSSLEVFLRYYEVEFINLARSCPAVVVCRCSPTQKATVVKQIRRRTKKRCAAVGDGGNDVSMIQEADCGIGIVGKEGRQASMAADFSITQFHHISRLLLVHGRNSYLRSAGLSQFVIHRGLIITTMQVVFSSIFYFASISLYQGVLMIGYATLYTNFPVFSLVLDIDVSAETALEFPDLYRDLLKGRALSQKTFFIWVAISLFQGGAIMYGALLVFEDELVHIVAISFTSLILTELIMVALTIRTWHRLMIVAELVSLSTYFLSMILLKDIFDPIFVLTFDFIGKVVLITLVSCLPLYIVKALRKHFSPPSYSKLS